jgi:hypothetical protein
VINVEVQQMMVPDRTVHLGGRDHLARLEQECLEAAPGPPDPHPADLGRLRFVAMKHVEHAFEPHVEGAALYQGKVEADVLFELGPAP